MNPKRSQESIMDKAIELLKSFTLKLDKQDFLVRKLYEDVEITSSNTFWNSDKK